MLHELAVSDLGVIDDLRLVLQPGMTALTGETGAGKTMLVEAISLLVGTRADSVLVRPGAREASVEGRFEVDGAEVVLARIVPADGRSRAYVNGRMATASVLAEWGSKLVDLHGQHAHQSLLSAAAQRATLDAFTGVDLAPLLRARSRLAELDAELAASGGDAGARAREVDLLRFQATELREAGLDDASEDERLEAEEDALSGAVAHREAGAAGLEALTGDGGARDALAAALAAVGGRAPFTEIDGRLRGLVAEAGDVASELRVAAEQIVDDRARLDEVRARRQMLHDLRRKYGTASIDGGPHPSRAGTLGDVLAYRDEVITRLHELEHHEARAAELEAARAEAAVRVGAAERKLGAERRAGAPELAKRVTAELHSLAMARAVLEVAVGEDPGDDVQFLLAANPGTPPLPLAKVASGGELARTMLAIRLVLTAAPPTLVFDEVDAGIGGEAALAVGRALAQVGSRHQVLVVTHLPQVAAFAHHQVQVSKRQRAGSTVSSIRALEHDDRVVEVARMLSGAANSPTAHQHAEELLAAGRTAGRGSTR